MNRDSWCQKRDKRSLQTGFQTVPALVSLTIGLRGTTLQGSRLEVIA